MSADELQRQLDERNQELLRAAHLELSRTNAELMQLTLELDDRVAQRTAELNKSNEALQIENTERKQAEEDLRRMATVVGDSNDAVILHDFDGKILAWNRGAKETYGYTETEALRMNVRDIVAEPDREAALTLIKKIKQGEFVKSFELRRVTKDGRILDVWLTTTLLTDEKDKPVAIATTERDITERKRTEEEIRKLNADLEQRVIERTAQLETANRELQAAKIEADRANRAKSGFLANMSHEIRTPMNAILGFSQLLLRDPTQTAAQRQYLDTINRSGEHLLTLINDILEMSKIEAGRITLTPVNFDLPALINEVERTFRLRTEAKKLEFSIVCLGEVPRYVVADEAKLRQVFFNLLSNAIKFTNRGGITVRIKVTPSAPLSADTLHVEVEDTGAGIAEAELHHLFQPFEQTQSGRKSGTGTGLGLVISREFVRLMGGEITVNSRIDEGTDFKFSIQFQTAPDVVVKPKPEPRRVLRLKSGHPPVRILIVDDKPDNLALLAALLEPMGFEIRQAREGAEALIQFDKWHPHLVLMDARMPGMDGTEAIRQIRAREKTSQLPSTSIIVLSASAFTEDHQAALVTGADDFLAKPFRESELFEKIGRWANVQYEYAEDAATPQSEVSTEALTRLPAGLIADLRTTIQNGDMGLFMQHLQGVAKLDAALAQSLRQLADQYEYETLLELLSTSQPKKL